MVERKIAFVRLLHIGPHAQGRGEICNSIFSNRKAPPARARGWDGTSPQNWGLQRIQKWIRRRPVRAWDGGGVSKIGQTPMIPPARARGWGERKIAFSELLLRVQPTRARGWGRVLRPHVERNVRDAMPTGGSSVSLSRRLGRDSRPFKSAAYMSICVRDSTSRNQGIYRA